MTSSLSDTPCAASCARHDLPAMDPIGAVTDSYDYDAFGNLILWLPKTPFSGSRHDVTLHREVSTTRFCIAESAQGRKP
jgi:hypothetical protein